MIKKPKSLVIWVAIPFIVIHSVIPHKEVRFLFPIAFLLPIIFAEAYSIIKSDSLRKITVVFLILINVPIMFLFSIRPANNEIADLEFMNKHKVESYIYYCIDNPAEIYGFYRLPEEHWYYTPIEVNQISYTDTAQKPKYYFISNHIYPTISNEYRKKFKPVHSHSEFIVSYLDKLGCEPMTTKYSRVLYKMESTCLDSPSKY